VLNLVFKIIFEKVNLVKEKILIAFQFLLQNEEKGLINFLEISFEIFLVRNNN
jgi:uncharacterized metal-binding protein